MRCVASTTVVILALGTCAVPASADSIVISQVTLDWRGFSFTATGGLVIDDIDRPSYQTFANASAVDWSAGTMIPTRTSDGDFTSTQEVVPDSISGATSLTNSGGTAYAFSSVSTDGFLQGLSVSSAFGDGSNNHIQASSSVQALESFWLYGHGSGALTVSIPYTLQIHVAADPPPEGAFRDDFIESSASVSLDLGPGAGWFTSDSVAWSRTDPVIDGSITKTGLLTLSRELHEPTFGPLISIGVRGNTSAMAAVPEPSTVALFAAGAFLIVGCRTSLAKRLRRSRDPQQIAPRQV